MNVHISLITHRHGINVACSKTEKGAYEEILKYVKEEWESELDEPCPKDQADLDLIVEYFDRVDEEFYDITEANLGK